MEEKDPHYSALERQTLRFDDLSRWDSQKFINFFSFVDLFYKEVLFRKKPTWKLLVDNATIVALEIEMKKDPEYRWSEFMYRIGEWSEPYHHDLHRQFHVRLMNNLTIVMRYCKKFPHVFTDEVKTFLYGKPQYDWAFPEKRGEVVDKTDISEEALTIELSKDITVSGAQRMLVDAMIRVAGIYTALANSITAEDLVKLSTKDKIDSIKKLSYLHELTKASKPNSVVFKQLNVGTAGKEELEHALLEFGQEG